ncbi:hypothetical protein NDN08_001665 [Rhodosorus marinus]|uniref:Uncharacterized protein n=1 Tax=Rhodosorus marinus TaxID=101924 RepID=A0AAV8URF7_9RHOD|nr:hypothetical protein NDN08_001665 [Rhodosorus marinus]
MSPKLPSLGKLPGLEFDNENGRYYPSGYAQKRDTSNYTEPHATGSNNADGIFRTILQHETGQTRRTRDLQTSAWTDIHMRNVREDHLISFQSHLRFSINEEGCFPAELPCPSRVSTGEQTCFQLSSIEKSGSLPQSVAVEQSAGFYPDQVEWFDRGRSSDLFVVVGMDTRGGNVSYMARVEDRQSFRVPAKEVLMFNTRSNTIASVSATSSGSSAPYVAFSKGSSVLLYNVGESRMEKSETLLTHKEAKVSSLSTTCDSVLYGTSNGSLVLVDRRQPERPAMSYRSSYRHEDINPTDNGVVLSSIFLASSSNRQRHRRRSKWRKVEGSKEEVHPGQLSLVDLRMFSRGNVLVFKGHKNSHRRFCSWWSPSGLAPLLCGGDDMGDLDYVTTCDSYDIADGIDPLMKWTEVLAVNRKGCVAAFLAQDLRNGASDQAGQ